MKYLIYVLLILLIGYDLTYTIKRESTKEIRKRYNNYFLAEKTLYDTVKFCK